MSTETVGARTTAPTAPTAPAVVHAHPGAQAWVGGPVVRREEREHTLAATLAPGATRPVGAGERAQAEEPDPYRLCFERDLDGVREARAEMIVFRCDEH